MIRRLLSIPVGLVKAPGHVVSGMWQDGGRGQFLVMGIPAVLVMMFGVGAVVLAYSKDTELRNHYESLAEQARSKADEIRKELQSEAGTRGLAGLPQDDERRGELKSEEDKATIFLQKLIDLDADNPEHKFQLALLAFHQGNRQRFESLLEVIAPFDEPGYAKAHLVLGQAFLSKRARSEQDRLLNIQRAERQIDNAIIADESNEEARRIKAKILYEQRKYLPAYQLYEELFDEDPIYYREMLQLARILGKTSEMQNILDRASYQFRQKINKNPENVSEWVKAWTHYVICLKQKRDFTTAEVALKSEIQKYRDDVGKEVFLKRQLSRVYSDRAVSRGREALADVKKLQLSDLAKSIENDQKNERALQWLTILGNTAEVGEEARKIYDPRYDPNTPWIVLSELGHHALKQEEYENAITFFERARKKHPRNPQILNNLAFAYLVSEGRNPEQALLLVDQAIIYLQKNPEYLGSNREEVVSSFFDTRGEALMQLNRMEEAAAAYEIAFRSRPDSAEIIEKLVECYEATGNERMAEAYRRRLEKVNEQQLEKARNAESN